jgi:hypothetical protein
MSPAWRAPPVGAIIRRPLRRLAEAKTFKQSNVNKLLNTSIWHLLRVAYAVQALLLVEFKLANQILLKKPGSFKLTMTGTPLNL